MSRAQALVALESPDRMVRLEAATTLGVIGEQKDRGSVLRALRNEPDPWVRRALGDSVTRLGRARQPIEVEDLGAEALADDLRANLIQELSELMLHEIRPLIGAAKLAASADIENYEASGTRSSLDRLSELLEAISMLSRAATAPQAVDEFDLSELVAGLVAREMGPDCPIDSVLAGPQPLPIVATRSLVEIVVANGLRNAVESVIDVAHAESCDGVVVNWGETDREYWLAIFDEGVGLPAGIDQLFEFGNSTKPKDKNFGLGLTIARRAIRSLRGSIRLTPREHGGAVYEARWPRQGEARAATAH